MHEVVAVVNVCIAFEPRFVCPFVRNARTSLVFVGIFVRVCSVWCGLLRVCVGVGGCGCAWVGGCFFFMPVFTLS